VAKSRNTRKNGVKSFASNSSAKFHLKDGTQLTISEKGIRQYEEIIKRDKSSWQDHEKVLVAVYEAMKSENTRTFRYID